MSSEFVALIEQALPSVDCYFLAEEKVLRHIELFSFEAHSWAMSHVWGLSKLGPLKELRERIFSTVSLLDFLYFNSVISQEKVHSEVLVSSIIGVVFPQSAERKNFPIILNK